LADLFGDRYIDKDLLERLGLFTFDEMVSYYKKRDKVTSSSLVKKVTSFYKLCYKGSNLYDCNNAFVHRQRVFNLISSVESHVPWRREIEPIASSNVKEVRPLASKYYTLIKNVKEFKIFNTNLLPEYIG
jgi:hypothetical protein